MKLTIKDLLNDLNAEQKDAVKTEKNAVIGAGAGSGKTKALAARYVYFIVEKNIDVENIIALTFTEKAAAEMHKRIYSTLKKIQHPNAEKAIEKFHLARISTLDSFCNSIVRLACKKFGIAPNFTIDNDESEKLAYRISLDFFLKYRADKAMQFFLAEHTIEDFVKKLFVKILTQYVCISRPLDFMAGLYEQIKTYNDTVKKTLSRVSSIFALAKEYSGTNANINEAKKIIEGTEIPESFHDKNFNAFITQIIKITTETFKGNKGGAEAKEIKVPLQEIRDTLLSVYNFEYAKDHFKHLFKLLTELQNEYILQKKQNGILTFADVSRLAVDALITDPDLRSFYKKDSRIIMIDEFQDNNRLQRDLLFLIAEKLERNEKSVPKSEELCPDKLFFVGDEKQSIYAFRGADVSVFRKLANEINPAEQNGGARLSVNYRTEPQLIDLFNIIFSKVFYSETNMPLKKDPNGNAVVPSYEAEYFPAGKREAVQGLHPKLEIMFLDDTCLKNAEDKNVYISKTETEAFYIAKRIREMYDSKIMVGKDKKTQPCTWNDFAVLMKASTHQGVYERVFRHFGIPYKSIQQKGLFNDAPINDIYALLKLSVYPADKKSYAQVLRSPFVNIDDDAFAILLLDFKTAFDIQAAEKLIGKNKAAYIRGCDLFERLQQNAMVMNCSELITHIWYVEGYRYFILSKEENCRYMELYDYLFELARQADIQGLTLSQFIDELSTYIEDGERLDDMEIPLERNTDAVSFLTVHKSKGLEFPIVVIPNCGSKGKSTIKEDLVFYDENFRAVIFCPQIKNMPEQKNMIFETLREEANQKLIAETKRLLYVAVTRAESYLIISGTDTAAAESGNENLKDTGIDGQRVQNARTLSEIKKIFLQKEAKKQGSSSKSFFQLLIPALPDEHADIIFTEIMPQKRIALSAKKEDAAERRNFAELYAHSKIKEFTLAEKKIIAATKLAKNEFKPSEERAYSFIPANAELTARNQTENFTPAELGTIAHQAIEARFLHKEFIYPEDTERKIKAWVENFFNSELYRLAFNAEKLKPEYAFLTEYSGKTVSGQIDLLFKTGETIYIVDYKTDETEEPERHSGQLSIYKKAASDLAAAYGAPCEVKAFVFYLKTGHYFEL